MGTTYSTMTAKGQVTVPSRLRRKLGLAPGLRVSLREVEGGVIIESPPDLATVRQRIRQEMERAGTWGRPVTPEGVWAVAAAHKGEAGRGKS